ncbi:zinc finger MYM-type protein 1-like, partial [Aphis craccivora]
LNLESSYPTDKGSFDNEVTDSIKRSILLFGPCRPNIEFPGTNLRGTIRRFSSNYYFMSTKMGSRIPRAWLCYSVILDKVYCEVCWLFANRSNSSFTPEWIDGINDWQHLSQKVKSHEQNSLIHLEATKLRTVWLKNGTIDKELETQISNEAKFWRDILTRIIKIILTLTAGNTALRGNECKEYSEGNFLRLVNLLAEFDPVLQTLLNNKENHIKYLSPTIQNELIGILGSSLLEIICDEIRQCSCFAIIMDSTQDITKIEQVSVIIRYVLIDFENHLVKIKESFLGFFEIHHHGAVDYKNLISQLLHNLGLDINKCKGQGYDGASVMSGIYSGLQKRINDIVPNAMYVHCCAHNLNLVVCDAAKSSDKAMRFFETVQSVFNFFGGSAPRWALLALGEDNATAVRKKVLKKVCATRWEARHNAVFALKERFVDVLKTLTVISLTSKKNEEIVQSKTLQKKIENIEFILLLCVWENILRSVQPVSKCLQSNDINIQNACYLLQQTIGTLEHLRENYDSVLNTAKCICNKWGITTQSVSKRQRYAKLYFDEVDGDRRLNVTEDNFKIKIFLPIIDTALAQLHNRFTGLNEVMNTFEFLNPSKLKNSEESSIIKSSYDFVLKYKSDINSDFTRQVLSITTLIGPEQSDIRDLINFIIQNDMACSFPDVLTACLIFLTIPVTVASAERSFSKLKLIKNYLRNSMSQNRLSNIAILNIERSRTDELDIEKIIDNFANAKARKKNFLC